MDYTFGAGADSGSSRCTVPTSTGIHKTVHGRHGKKKQTKTPKLVARELQDGKVQACADPRCTVQATPQWRLNPSGRTPFCNACGLQIKKMLKKEKKIAPREGEQLTIHKMAIDYFVSGPEQDS